MLPASRDDLGAGDDSLLHDLIPTKTSRHSSASSFPISFSLTASPCSSTHICLDPSPRTAHLVRLLSLLSSPRALPTVLPRNENPRIRRSADLSYPPRCFVCPGCVLRFFRRGNANPPFLRSDASRAQHWVGESYAQNEVVCPSSSCA